MSNRVSDLLTVPLLPSGLKIGGGRDPRGRPVVRLDVRLDGAAEPLAIVVPPITARQAATVLLDQDDRRLRVLGALLLRQAALVEGSGPATAFALGLVGAERSQA